MSVDLLWDFTLATRYWSVGVWSSVPAPCAIQGGVECGVLPQSCGMPALFNSVRTGGFFSLWIFYMQVRLHIVHSQKKKRKKNPSLQRQIATCGWKITEMYMQVQKLNMEIWKWGLGVFLSKKTDLLFIAGNCMGFYFLSSWSQKKKIEKKIHRCTITVPWLFGLLWKWESFAKLFSWPEKQQKR